ncbi:MAG: hypothetical protein IKU12_02860, partial [Oscillospiraceae bacterium]|nr:hypothetical protein [Oscillospiraceae bacterium]
RLCRRSGKQSEIVFHSDMCGGKNTSREACARAANGGDKVLLGCVRAKRVRKAECDPSQKICDFLK